MAVLIAGIAAVLAGIAGFVGGIWVCSVVFSGEATESALVIGPATALVFAAAVFIIMFRKMTMFGDSPDDKA